MVPHLFREEYRQQQEKSLLKVSSSAGFGSYAQFYRVFKKAYGRVCVSAWLPLRLRSDGTEFREEGMLKPRYRRFRALNRSIRVSPSWSGRTRIPAYLPMKKCLSRRLRLRVFLEVSQRCFLWWLSRRDSAEIRPLGRAFQRAGYKIA